MHPTRRKILRTALSIGGLAAMRPLDRALAESPAPARTPMQTLGPFYPVTRPLDADADLTLIQGHSARASGKTIHLMGRVLDTEGRPVRGARVELWQANAHGRYAHPADVNPAPLDPNFQGFGVQITDGEGRYRFRTIKPAAYPVNPMNPGAVRTPHIHFDVLGRNSRLVTQMYFPGEATNASDILFGKLGAEGQRATIADLLPPTQDLEPDSLIAHWDIILVAG